MTRKKASFNDDATKMVIFVKVWNRVAEKDSAGRLDIGKELLRDKVLAPIVRSGGAELSRITPQAENEDDSAYEERKQAEEKKEKLLLENVQRLYGQIATLRKSVEKEAEKNPDSEASRVLSLLTCNALRGRGRPKSDKRGLAFEVARLMGLEETANE